MVYKKKWQFQFPDYASYELQTINNKKPVKDIYDLLKSRKSSFFHQREYTQIFIASMALGYVNKNRLPLKHKSRSIPTKVFSKEEKWMMISIAIEQQKDLSIIKEEQKILNLAEEYANGGIYFLYELYEEGITTNPIENLEVYFRQELNRRISI